MIENLSQHIKNTIENFGFQSCCLKYDDHAKKVTKVVAGINPVFCACDSDHQIQGIFRLPHDHRSEFDEEMVVQKLIKVCDLVPYVFKAEVVHLAIDCHKLWARLQPTISVTKNQNNFNKIITAPSIQTAENYARTLSAEELDQLWDEPTDRHLDYGDNAMIKRVMLRTVLCIVYEKAMNPSVVVNEMTLPVMMLMRSGMVNDTQANPNQIPTEKQNKLKAALNCQTLLPIHFDPTPGKCVPLSYFFLYKDFNFAKFSEQVSTASFENLMFLSLLLELPSLSPSELSYKINLQGSIDLFIWSSKLRIYTVCEQGVCQNCLLSFPQVHKPVSKEFKVKLERIKLDLELSREFSSEKRKLLMRRVRELENTFMIENLTWIDVITAHHRVWLKTAQIATKIAKSHLTSFYTYFKATSLRSYIDILTRPELPCNISAIKQELKETVKELMPLMVQGVLKYTETHTNFDRQPFLDESRDVKGVWLGKNCCGLSTCILGILLRSRGYPVQMTSYTSNDHVFLRLEVAKEVYIYIDPTIRQMYEHLATDELLKIPEIFVGKSTELKLIFDKYHKDRKQNRWLAGLTYSFDPSYNLDSLHRTLIDPAFLKSQGNFQSELNALIKDVLTDKEMQVLKEKYTLPDACKLLSHTRVSRPIMPLTDMIQNFIDPYFFRILIQLLNYYSKRNEVFTERDILDKFSKESLFGFFAYLLHNQGYQVHHKGSFASSQYFPYLEVMDIDGSNKCIVPFFRSIIRKFYPNVQIVNLPSIFIGNEPQLEQMINELLPNDENTFILDRSIACNDAYIYNFFLAVTNPDYFNNATGVDRLISGMVRDMFIWGIKS